MEQSKNKPVHELRIGSIKAAIWKNNGSTRTWHSVSFERLYKDGEEWKSTASFSRDDLLLLAKLADRTHTWIVEHDSEERVG